MTRAAWVVTDLGFGDAGKGALTDFLVRDRRAQLVVRANGGAQAGHNVVTEGGRHHTFSQLGAGSFVPGVQTYLGPAFVLHPGGLLVEAEHLARTGVRDALARTHIDAGATVISPFQQAAGCLREVLRGAGAHGTCGVGVGEAVGDRLAGHDDTIRAGDLLDRAKLRRCLAAQQERKRAEFASLATEVDRSRARAEIELLDDPRTVDLTLEQWAGLPKDELVVGEGSARALLAAAETIVCEGAQGVLLDEQWGFHPHTTWSDCTPRGALELLAGTEARITRLGVLRAYATRHGAGPFPTHSPARDATHVEPHNAADGWQGTFRTGALDLVLLRYALAVCGGVDALALGHLDEADELVPVCTAYRAAPEDRELIGASATGHITRLPPGEPGDLAHRERLGRALRRVTCNETLVPRDDLPNWLEHELGVPIAIVADGPTANHRRWRSGGAHPKTLTAELVERCKPR